MSSDAAPRPVPPVSLPPAMVRTRSGRRAVKVRTIPEAWRVFRTQRSPRILMAATAVLLLGRLVWARWRVSDLIVAGVLLGAQPFTEWVIHVYVLHVRPGGRVTNALDRAAGLAHRLHHEDPYDLRWQFIHPRAAWGLVVVDAAVVLAFRTPAAATGALMAVALTLTYEWVHFLIHTDVPPRRWPYREIHRAHRLHHYRNENYWLGVTNHLGDRVLRTYPAKDDVPVSPTARTALARVER